MQVLAFGIIKDIFNDTMLEIDLKEGETINQLKFYLEKKFPRLNELGSYMIALNNEYASGEDEIKQGDELAIIPPVSGG